MGGFVLFIFFTILWYVYDVSLNIPTSVTSNDRGLILYEERGLATNSMEGAKEDCLRLTTSKGH